MNTAVTPARFSVFERAALHGVVQQHLDEAIPLRRLRSRLLRSPHTRLHHLQRLDERLAAQLDGLMAAGASGAKQCTASLATPGVGQVFTAAVCAIEGRDTAGLERLLPLCEALPEVQHGLLSAVGWVPAGSLRGIAKVLLDSPVAFHKAVGLAACRFHSIDPGTVLDAALLSPSPMLKIAGLHLCAALGQVQRLPACLPALEQQAPLVRWHAARTAIVLGERQQATTAMLSLATTAGPLQTPALRWLMKLLPAADSRALLKNLKQSGALDDRLLIRATGWSGDVSYMPWLLGRTADLDHARVAGEAISSLTGLDLATLDLDRPAPPEAPPSPAEDPADHELGLGDDDDLPWPAPEKLQAWWASNGMRFLAGQRYFMGDTVNESLCLSVLRTGFQRQRIAAAEYLALCQPGKVFFNTSAPAWRQERLLKTLQP